MSKCELLIQGALLEHKPENKIKSIYKRKRFIKIRKVSAKFLLILFCFQPNLFTILSLMVLVDHRWSTMYNDSGSQIIKKQKSEIIYKRKNKIQI